MTVYVDDMRARYGRMVMCHMIADTDVELHDMAARIGISRRWHQKPGTARSHYDIALSKRSLAMELGAVGITWRVAGCMTRRRELTGELGHPDDALKWRRGVEAARWPEEAQQVYPDSREKKGPSQDATGLGEVAR